MDPELLPRSGSGINHSGYTTLRLATCHWRPFLVCYCTCQWRPFPFFYMPMTTFPCLLHANDDLSLFDTFQWRPFFVLRLKCWFLNINRKSSLILFVLVDKVWACPDVRQRVRVCQRSDGSQHGGTRAQDQVQECKWSLYSKGTVSRDFRPLFFLFKRFDLGPIWTGNREEIRSQYEIRKSRVRMSTTTQTQIFFFRYGGFHFFKFIRKPTIDH